MVSSLSKTVICCCSSRYLKTSISRSPSSQPYQFTMHAARHFDEAFTITHSGDVVPRGLIPHRNRHLLYQRPAIQRRPCLQNSSSLSDSLSSDNGSQSGPLGYLTEMLLGPRSRIAALPNSRIIIIMYSREITMISHPNHLSKSLQ